MPHEDGQHMVVATVRFSPGDPRGDGVAKGTHGLRSSSTMLIERCS